MCCADVAAFVAGNQECLVWEAVTGDSELEDLAERLNVCINQRDDEYRRKIVDALVAAIAKVSEVTHLELRVRNHA